MDPRALQRGLPPFATLKQQCVTVVIRHQGLFANNKHLLKLIPSALAQQILDKLLQNLPIACIDGMVLLEALISSGHISCIVCTTPQHDHMLSTLVNSTGENAATSLRALKWWVSSYGVLPPLLGSLQALQVLSLPGKTVVTSSDASMMTEVVRGLPRLRRLAVKLWNPDATALFISGLSHVVRDETLLIKEPVQLAISGLQSDWPKWLHLHDLVLRGDMKSAAVQRLSPLAASPLTALSIMDMQRNSIYVQLFNLLGSNLNSVRIVAGSSPSQQGAAVTNNIDLSMILTLLPSITRLICKLGQVYYKPTPEQMKTIEFAKLMELDVAGLLGSDVPFLEAALRRSENLKILTVTGVLQLELVLRMLMANANTCESLTDLAVRDVPDAAVHQIVKVTKLLALRPQFAKLCLGGLRPRAIQQIKLMDPFFKKYCMSRNVNLVGFNHP